MQFDGEKADKITRGACACNDDKFIFENPLNWTTLSFIFTKQGSTNMGLPLRSPVANYRASGLTWLSSPNRKLAKDGQRSSAMIPMPDESSQTDPKTTHSVMRLYRQVD